MKVMTNRVGSGKAMTNTVTIRKALTKTVSTRTVMTGKALIMKATTAAGMIPGAMTNGAMARTATIGVVTTPTDMTAMGGIGVRIHMRETVIRSMSLPATPSVLLAKERSLRTARPRLVK